MSRSHARFEKRDAERYDYPARIEYVLDPSNARYKAVTINISSSGMALYTFWKMQAGQEIIITSKLPVDHRRALVRWTREQPAGMFKMGVKFMPGMEPDQATAHGLA